MPETQPQLPSIRPPSLPAPRAFDRDRLFVIFFFAAYFYLLYQLLLVLAPFLAPLLGAAMLAVVVFPLRKYVERVVTQPTAAALIMTVLVMITVVVPLTLLAWLLTREATAAIPALNAWLAAQQTHGWSFAQGEFPALFERLWNGLNRLLDMIELDVRSVALEGLREVGNRVTSAGATLVREFFGVLFQIMILVLALFFFLRDGPRMIRGLVDLIPMEDYNKALVLGGLDRTLVAMVRGTVITASAQGTLTGIGLAIFGVPFPVLLGFVATVLAVVPIVGAALVWVPAGIYLAVTDHVPMAAGLALWGLFGVGLIDNFLRPFVVGGHAQLPATLLFLGVLGGLQVYGLVGGLISPLLIACVFAFARIYRERYIENAS